MLFKIVPLIKDVSSNIEIYLSLIRQSLFNNLIGIFEDMTNAILGTKFKFCIRTCSIKLIIMEINMISELVNESMKHQVGSILA